MKSLVKALTLAIILSTIAPASAVAPAAFPLLSSAANAIVYGGVLGYAAYEATSDNDFSERLRRELNQAINNDAASKAEQAALADTFSTIPKHGRFMCNAYQMRVTQATAIPKLKEYWKDWEQSVGTYTKCHYHAADPKSSVKLRCHWTYKDGSDPSYEDHQCSVIDPLDPNTVITDLLQELLEASKQTSTDDRFAAVDAALKKFAEAAFDNTALQQQIQGLRDELAKQKAAADAQAKAEAISQTDSQVGSKDGAKDATKANTKTDSKGKEKDKDKDKPAGDIFPQFCVWATPVCDLLAWLRQPVPEPPPPTPVLPVSTSELGLPDPTNTTAINFTGSCPSKELRFELGGHTIAKPIPMHHFCQLLETIAPWLLAFTYLSCAILIIKVI